MLLNKEEQNEPVEQDVQQKVEQHTTLAGAAAWHTGPGRMDPDRYAENPKA